MCGATRGNMSRGMMSCRIVSTLTDEPALIPTHVAAGHSSDETAGGVALTKTAANQVVEVGATSSRPARHEVLHAHPRLYSLESGERRPMAPVLRLAANRLREPSCVCRHQASLLSWGVQDCRRSFGHAAPIPRTRTRRGRAQQNFIVCSPSSGGERLAPRP